jgi:hypothetical protein
MEGKIIYPVAFKGFIIQQECRPLKMWSALRWKRLSQCSEINRKSQEWTTEVTHQATMSVVQHTLQISKSYEIETLGRVGKLLLVACIDLPRKWLSFTSKLFLQYLF